MKQACVGMDCLAFCLTAKTNLLEVVDVYIFSRGLMYQCFKFLLELKSNLLPKLSNVLAHLYVTSLQRYFLT